MYPTDGEAIRVFLVDDHDLVRRGLRDLVSAAKDITVVGESSSAQAAPGLILQAEPEVMVLDLHLQDGTGVHVCRQVRAANPEVRALLLTAAADDEAAVAALLAGAEGFTTKFAQGTDLVGSIRAVGRRRNLMDQELVSRVTARFHEELDRVIPRLTDEDREILAAVLAGHTDTEIAGEFGVDVDPVRERVAVLVEQATGLSGGAAATGEGDSPSGRHRRG